MKPTKLLWEGLSSFTILAVLHILVKYKVKATSVMIGFKKCQGMSHITKNKSYITSRPIQANIPLLWPLQTKMWQRRKPKRGAWQDISDKIGILLLGEEKNSQLFDAEKVTLPNVPWCWVLSFIWQFVSKTFYPTRTFSLADSPSQTFVFFRKVGKTFIRSPPYNFCRCMIETLLYSKYLGKAIIQEIQFTQIVSEKAV